MKNHAEDMFPNILQSRLLFYCDRLFAVHDASPTKVFAEEEYLA